MPVPSRTKAYTLSTKWKDVPTQAEKPSTGWEGLYLLVGSVPGPRPILMWPSEGQKAASLSGPFPTLASLSQGFSVRFCQVSAGIMVT